MTNGPSPALVATLVGAPRSRALLATVADLVERGYLDVADDGRLAVRRPPDGAAGDPGRAVLDALLALPAVTAAPPEILGAVLRVASFAVAAAADAEAVARGLAPETVRARRRRRRLVVLLALAGVPLAFVWPPAALLGVAGAAAALAALGRRPRLTPAGERKAARWSSTDPSRMSPAMSVALGELPPRYARLRDLMDHGRPAGVDRGRTRGRGRSTDGGAAAEGSGAESGGGGAGREL